MSPYSVFLSLFAHSHCTLEVQPVARQEFQALGFLGLKCGRKAGFYILKKHYSHSQSGL